ncbi:MAG: hypothetical protein H0W30_10600 [Gemmatimonadaceae bacterium]|nr:hypothetical protein [Gemmatimonadaceae bacterium]
MVKKITTGATFRFHHKLLYIANSLVSHRIGLEETDDGVWSIYFNTVLIATLDERDYRVTSKVLPMLLDTSVTYVPGCSEKSSASLSRRSPITGELG